MKDGYQILQQRRSSENRTTTRKVKLENYTRDNQRWPRGL